MTNLEKPNRSPVTVTVIRHRRERLKKCSLRNLHKRPEIRFILDHDLLRFDASGHVLLDVDGPLLSVADAGHPLLILDSSWRWLPGLRSRIDGEPLQRSLPAVPTAYPRVSKLFEDPVSGLASVEALYLARRVLGEDDPSLLDGYRWKTEFLEHVERHLDSHPPFG